MALSASTSQKWHTPDTPGQEYSCVRSIKCSWKRLQEFSCDRSSHRFCKDRPRDATYGAGHRLPANSFLFGEKRATACPGFPGERCFCRKIESRQAWKELPARVIGDKSRRTIDFENKWLGYLWPDIVEVFSRRFNFNTGLLFLRTTEFDPILW